MVIKNLKYFTHIKSHSSQVFLKLDTIMWKLVWVKASSPIVWTKSCAWGSLGSSQLWGPALGHPQACDVSSRPWALDKLGLHAWPRARFPRGLPLVCMRTPCPFLLEPIVFLLFPWAGFLCQSFRQVSPGNRSLSPVTASSFGSCPQTQPSEREWGGAWEFAWCLAEVFLYWETVKAAPICLTLSVVGGPEWSMTLKSGDPGGWVTRRSDQQQGRTVLEPTPVEESGFPLKWDHGSPGRTRKARREGDGKVEVLGSHLDSGS